MGIKPSKGYVAVELIVNEQTGTIILPKEDNKPLTRGKVLGKGKGVIDYSRDDVVVFKTYQASELELKKEKILLIHEDDILAKITND